MTREAGCLDGKIALVTGGARGVGRAITTEIARLGAHVVINYCHSEQHAEQTGDDLRRQGASVDLLRASVSRDEPVQRMFTAIENRWGRLDILVNNAASGGLGSLDTLTAKDWKRAIETNLYGTLRCSRAAALLMRKTGGVICNVSSTGSSSPVPGYAAVGVTKAAVESLTRYLAYEYRTRKIRVNCASAGPLESRPLRQLVPDPAVERRLRSQTPAGRLGTTDELAAVVGFLVSPASEWLWGQTIVADGGLSLSTWPMSATDQGDGDGGP